MRVGVHVALSLGRQLKFRKKDGLVPIAIMLMRMCWPLPEKHVIVYFLACKPLTSYAYMYTMSSLVGFVTVF